MAPMKMHFDHEKLDVYQDAIGFVSWLVAKKRIDSADAGKAILVRIVSMLVGLIRSTSGSRVYENPTDYRAESV